MNPRILVVDDEELLRKSLARAFRMDGWECHTAACASEALLLLEGATPFDAVIVDYLMPDLRGTDVLRWVRGRHPSTKRFLMTAQLDFQNDSEAAELAHSILQKPFVDVTEIPKTVRLFLPCE